MFGWLRRLFSREERKTAVVGDKSFEYTEHEDGAMIANDIPPGISCDDASDAMIKGYLGKFVESGKGYAIYENARGERTRVLTFPKWAITGNKEAST